MTPFLLTSNTSFGFQHSSGMSDTANISGPIIFMGNFREENKLLIGGKVQAGDFMSVSPDINGQYNFLFADRTIPGNTYKLTLEKPVTNSKNQVISDSFYHPQLLRIYEPVPSVLSEENTIDVGKLFTWAPDPQNPSGEIAVSIEYDPNKIGNQRLKKKGKQVGNALIIKDNGSFEITAALLKDIPKGAEVEVTLTRNNYKTKADGDGKPYTLFAYSNKYFTFKYQ
jgi:hypothetical protein